MDTATTELYIGRQYVRYRKVGLLFPMTVSDSYLKPPHVVHFWQPIPAFERVKLDSLLQISYIG